MNNVEKILPYEKDLFLWLNHCHNPFWDKFMQIYSGKIAWIPLCLVLLITIFYKTKWKYAALYIGCFILLVTLCDQISASVIKPFFSRFRPTHHPDFMNNVLVVEGYRGGRFGFISAHAANGFGAATFMALVFKYRYLTITLFTWSLVTCFSRVYLGVHFISDVIGGMVLGTIIGFLTYLLYQYGRIKWIKEDYAQIDKSVFTHQQGNIIIIGIYATIISITLYSLITTYLV